MKNLKGLVPARGRGQSRVIQHGVWSEISGARNWARLRGKESSQASLIKALSSFLAIGFSGHLFDQVNLAP